MTRISLAPLCTAGALLLAAGPLRADPIQDPVPYLYDWSQSTRQVAAGGSGAAGVTFTPVTDATGSGSGLITAAIVHVYRDAGAGGAASFTGQSFTMTVTITEGDRHGSLSFTGHLWGSITDGSARVTGTFDPKTATQSLRLGAHVYTVSIGPFIGVNYTAPGGARGAGGLGGAAGSVNATVQVGGHAPEPTALVLAALGLGGLVLCRRRRLPPRPVA